MKLMYSQDMGLLIHVLIDQESWWFCGGNFISPGGETAIAPRQDFCECFDGNDSAIRWPRQSSPLPWGSLAFFVQWCVSSCFQPAWLKRKEAWQRCCSLAGWQQSFIGQWPQEGRWCGLGPECGRKQDGATAFIVTKNGLMKKAWSFKDH